MTATSPAGVDLPRVAAQLDQEILETQRRLDELRELRGHAEALFKYAQALMRGTEAVQQSEEMTTSSTRSASLTDQVVDVFENDPDAVLEVGDVVSRLAANDIAAEAGSVRNAIYYAEGTQHRLIKVGRGRFALKKPSTPHDGGVDAVAGPQIWLSRE